MLRVLYLLALLAALPPGADAQTSWTPLGDGLTGEAVAALAFAPPGHPEAGHLYVGGGFWMEDANGNASQGIGRWDGAAWHGVGGGLEDGGSVLALAFGSDGRLYAGGGIWRFVGNSTIMSGIAAWDGASWSAVGGGVDRIEGNQTYSADVYALALGPDGRMYVGGDFNRGRSGSVPMGLVGAWDGLSWSGVGGAGLGGGELPEVRALVFGPDGRLYVGGRFTTADGEPVANVAAWDGTAWDDLNGGLPSTFGVTALAFGPDWRLYAVGLIGTVGGVVTDVAAWDGTAWAPAGPSVQGGFYALAFSADGKLYAGGEVTLPDGSQDVARLDGFLAGPGAGVWVPLGSGVTHPTGEEGVRALAVGLEGEVYVGGFFDRVWEAPGGPSLPASNVAVWLGDRVVGAEAPVEARALALSVSPNPARGAATVSVTLASPSPVRVVVVDALGRTVAVVHDGPLGAGRHRLSLPSALAPGVYAVRVTSGEAVAVARWVVAR